MCGIFGLVLAKNTLTAPQVEFIRQATIVGQVRGDDGTGWILRNSDGDIDTYKKAMNGNDFLESRVGRKGESNLRYAQVVIGHNRKSTSGGDRDRDCHPYDYDNVVGVHNGGFPSTVLSRMDTTKATSAVDSSKFYAGLDAEENPLVTLKKLHLGSYVLVWIDKRTNTLCIARNKDRPLWAASSSSGMYFASEPFMLAWLMSRYGLDDKDSKLLELKEECLYKIPLDDPAKIVRSTYTPKIPTYASPPTRNYGNEVSSVAIASYKYIESLEELETAFPIYKDVADIVRENIAIIDRDREKKTAEDDNRIDVIITDVLPKNHNSNYPELRGYLQDVTNTGMVIPVTFPSLRDDGNHFNDKFISCEKDNCLFTVSATLTGIKLRVDGSLNLSAKFKVIWNQDSNVVIDDTTKAAAEEVRETLMYKVASWSYQEMTSMWSALKKAAVKTTH